MPGPEMGGRSHAIAAERYGSSSRLWRSRWITEGVAAYAEYLVAGKLAPELFNECASYLLPFFSLEETSLEAMVKWKYPDRLPPEDMLQHLRHYGAAAGLILRVREAGGPNAVVSMLDLLKERRRVREQEIDATLVKITGQTYADLARMPSAERETAYREALEALEGSGRWRRIYGLEVLSRFKDRTDQYRDKVAALVSASDVDDGVRAKAKELIAHAGPDQP